MIIRAYFGLNENPFSLSNISLLPHQEEIFQILQVHSQQGGLCLLLGEPGTGKSVIKNAFLQLADKDKRLIVASVGRTMHSYHSTLKIFCDAFQVQSNGPDSKCEQRLIEHAFNINRQGKSLVTIIDEAHLLDIITLRKLRLLFEEFPKNHNLILLGQTSLLLNLNLIPNHDIKSRITYSSIIQKLNPDLIEEFIFSQLDRIRLPHSTFCENALQLIIRASEGILRRTRNLCLSSLLETVREQKKEVSLETVNRVLMQPHWRKEYDLDKI